MGFLDSGKFIQKKAKNMYKKRICQKLNFLMDDFIEEMNVLNKSINTITSYKQTIKSFLEFLEQYDRNFNFSNLGSLKKGLIKFLAYKTDNLNRQVDENGKYAEAKESSQRLYLQHLKSFFEYVELEDQEDYKIEDLFKKHIKINIPKRKPKEFDKDSIEKLIKSLEENKANAYNFDPKKSRAKNKEKAKNNKIFIANRDALLVKIYLYSGIRASEILLKIKEFKLVEDIYEFNVIGKGNKERKAYILAEKIKEELEYFKSNGYKVFAISINNNMLDRSQIWKIISRKFKEAGVKETGIHKFRHTLAKTIYRETKDIITVKDMLGHSSINTTMIYADENEENIKRNYRKAIKN